MIVYKPYHGIHYHEIQHQFAGKTWEVSTSNRRNTFNVTGDLDGWAKELSGSENWSIPQKKQR